MTNPFGRRTAQASLRRISSRPPILAGRVGARRWGPPSIPENRSLLPTVPTRTDDLGRSTHARPRTLHRRALVDRVLRVDPVAPQARRTARAPSLAVAIGGALGGSRTVRRRRSCSRTTTPACPGRRCWSTCPAPSCWRCCSSWCSTSGRHVATSGRSSATGFLGAYTTFSSLAVEVDRRLVRRRDRDGHVVPGTHPGGRPRRRVVRTARSDTPSYAARPSTTTS